MIDDIDLDGDTLREECGVFGIFGHPDAAALTALGLHALQHRGQEAAGIVSYDGDRFHSERRMGLVGDHFSSDKIINRLKGTQALGHVRYSTTGETILRNVQPLFAELAAGGIATAHNGNLTNGLTLRRDLITQGAIYQSTSDTEAILHLVARSKKSRLIERYIDALRSLEGAYALVSLTNKKLIGARDPLGIRPLILGELNGAYILCSETVALDIIGAKFVREVENGEVVVISENGIESLHPFPRMKPRPCIFNIFISQDQIPFLVAVRFMMCAKTPANNWPLKHLLMQMLSYPFLTQAFQRQLAMRRPLAFHLNSASSAITMWAAPLLNRRNTFALWE